MTKDEFDGWPAVNRLSHLFQLGAASSLVDERKTDLDLDSDVIEQFHEYYSSLGMQCLSRYSAQQVQGYGRGDLHTHSHSSIAATRTCTTLRTCTEVQAHPHQSDRWHLRNE
jgi:hypothetical protein